MLVLEWKLVKMAKRIKFVDLLPIYRAMEKAPGSLYKLVITNDGLKSALALAIDDSNIDESGIAVRLCFRRGLSFDCPKYQVFDLFHSLCTARLADRSLAYNHRKRFGFV